MKLICKNIEYKKETLPVIVGEEYLVLGLTFRVNGGIHVLVQTGKYWIGFVPIEVFDIKDSRVSKYWRLKYFDGGNIGLWHPVMYKPYFLDDLSEDVAEIVEEYLKVYQEMIDEHWETIEYSVDVSDIIGSLQGQAG